MTTSRATYARQWRLGARQSRRFDTLASDYVLTKYPAIHKEITEFYDTLNTKYDTKHNLTKTPEYRLWKADQGTSTTAPATAAGQEQRTSDEPGQGTSTTAPATAAGQEQGTSDEPGQGTSTTAPATAAGQEQGTSDEPGQGTSTTAPTASDDLIPQYDLDLDGMDSVINNIINELSQDEEIRALLEQPFDFEECYW